MSTIYTLNRINRSEISLEELAAESPLGQAGISFTSPIPRFLATEFAYLWKEFDLSLEQVPVVRNILDSKISREEYMALICNMRQQVIDGANWISRALSYLNIAENPNFVLLRQRIVQSLYDENMDYQMLENDYVALGGSREDIINQPQNIGSAALSAFMFSESSKPNPIHMLGALFIIEGMGKMKAGEWADRIDSTLDLQGKGLGFLRHHAQADQEHINRFLMLINLPFITEEIAEKMVKTAKITAALYAMQLAHLNDC